ncbi:MAG: hypothetical protein K2L18_11430 [Acetatifactor sp.]|nr:hypothetical protein [Acetatifactor sp.]
MMRRKNWKRKMTFLLVAGAVSEIHDDYENIPGGWQRTADKRGSPGRAQGGG